MPRIIILGGRGFVGSAIVKQLEEKNLDVYTADRKQGKEKHLCIDISDKKSLETLVQSGDVIVNLVGLTPVKTPKGNAYQRVHVDAIQNIVELAKEKQCRLIHMSALGADANGATEYLRTKGEAEQIILNADINASIVCPSIIYDEGNELIEMMRQAARFGFFPKLPSIMQPVYREDIAALFVDIIEGKKTAKKYLVGGPEQLSIFKMAALLFQAQGKSCRGIPFFVVKIGMTIASLLPGTGIRKDQRVNLFLHNVIGDNEKEEVWITPTEYSLWIQDIFSKK